MGGTGEGSLARSTTPQERKEDCISWALQCAPYPPGKSWAWDRHTVACSTVLGGAIPTFCHCGFVYLL